MTSDNTLIKTHIDGLDRLFGKGIKTTAGGNLCMILEGKTGTSKTTLALQIATNIARQENAISVFFSIDQPLESLRKKAESFNWVKGNLFLSGLDKNIQRSTESKDGHVFLLSAPADDFLTMKASIGSNIQEISKRIPNKPIKCIVVDSLNAVNGEISRDEYRSFNESCAKASSLSIFVDEETPDTERFNLRWYISEIVIELGYRYTTGKQDYSERYIEIIKARNQFHYRGKHFFSIADPERVAREENKSKHEVEGGIRVYPSMGARLSYQVSKSKTRTTPEEPSEPSITPEEPKRFVFGLDTLDQFLYDEQPGGVARGSTTLLIGERGSKKTVIGLHFLAAGLKSGEKCMLISLKDDEPAIVEIAQGYAKLKNHISRENKNLKIKYIGPSYVAPGRFVENVTRWIEEAKENDKEIKRVLFDNVVQIKHRFPLLNAEPMFIPTIIDLFKRNGITSLFVEIVEEPSQPILESHSPVIDLSDYVVATQHLPFLGKDHIVISVRRSREGRHNSEPAEVRREGNAIVIDENAFEGITGVLEKNPKPAEIFLKLFYENEKEREFNNEIKTEFDAKYKDKVQVSSFSRGESSTEYGRIKRYWLEGPQSTVKVVSLDEHWVKFAASENLIWQIKDDWFAKDLGQRWIDRYKDDFLPSILQSAMDGDNLFAVPNYLDLGLFCYRTDIFTDIFGNIEKPNTFNKLIELVNSKTDEIKKLGLCGFGFDMETEETLACTFLEFLSNTCTDKGKVGEIFCSATVVKPYDLKEAIIITLETLKNLKESGIMPYPCILRHCKDAIFVRLWYSNLQHIYYYWWNAAKKNGELKGLPHDANFGIMRFPTIGQDNGAKSKNTKCYCCSGSWYLGILKQSLKPRLGFHLIDEITSVDKNLKRYDLGAGFPARKSFYRFHGNENVKNVEGLTYGQIIDCVEGRESSDRKLFRREAFCGGSVATYREVRSDIADIVLKVFEGEKPENAADMIVNAIEKAMSRL